MMVKNTWGGDFLAFLDEVFEAVVSLWPDDRQRTSPPGHATDQ